MAIYNYFKDKHTSKKVEENSGKFLVSLDTFKKAIVYGLYLEEDHTEELPLNSGAVVHLEHMMVIGKATNQYFIDNLNNPVFPYMLQPWVIEKLNNDNELLESYKEAYMVQSRMCREETLRY
ncbi:super-infection exclusion protein B [Clostridium sp.]|uniref:super-infection exclusion protein B n=1 Tax=Clostridium sp. TaxID=1506 RepID=UPI003F30A4C2